jgi:GNAT superfamily N-acetyltransferase
MKHRKASTYTRKSKARNERTNERTIPTTKTERRQSGTESGRGAQQQKKSNRRRSTCTARGPDLAAAPTGSDAAARGEIWPVLVRGRYSVDRTRQAEASEEASGGRRRSWRTNLRSQDERRRGGIGRALIDAVREHSGRETVRLMVVGSNTDARAFYEAIGFRELFVELENRPRG